MRTIDLRSDTVTLPTPRMREAMYNAELGDDVYGEDPTVNRLETVAAEKLGMEAALFVVSGTMGNLVSLLTHCGRGNEVIMGDIAHTFVYEAGGSAAVGGIHAHTVPNQPDGTMDLADLEAAIRGDNIHFPRTRLICLENTHNRCGGAVVPVQYMADVKALASRYGLSVHLDGARVFNAAVALGVDVSEIAAQVDSVQLCLSKGLAAPVGSMICGTAEFIAEARRNRKLVGGGMRQAGVIAAAGLLALDEMVERLADDHANARWLAEGLAGTDGLGVDLDTVQTDIVMFRLEREDVTPDQVVDAMAQRGVKFLAIAPPYFRAVTHYGIEQEDIAYTIDAFREVMGAL